METTGNTRPNRHYFKGVDEDGYFETQAFLDGEIEREKVTTRYLMGRVTMTIFEEGATSAITYDSLGRNLAQTNPDGITQLTAYNERGEAFRSAIDLNGNGVIDLGIDRITESASDITIENGIAHRRQQSFVYLPGSTEPSLISTSLSVIDCLSSKSISAAGESSSVTAITGEGAWTITSTQPNGTSTVQTYSGGLAQSTTWRDANEATISSQSVTRYDELNRPIARRDSRHQNDTTVVYNPNGAIASQTDAAGNTTSFTYDVRGRQIAVDAPDTTAGDNIFTTAYNATGQVLVRSGAGAYQTTYAYDYAGRQIGLTTYRNVNSEGDTTTWTYDSDRGFLTRKTYANGDSLSYTYAPDGRLLTRTGGRGIVTTYVYDEATGQLLTTDYSDGTPDITNTFDYWGRLTKAERGGIVWDYTFTESEVNGYLVTLPNTETMNLDIDADGTSDFTKTLVRGFDALQRPSSVEVKENEAPASFQTSYAYDQAGRLATVTSAAGAFTYAYAPNSDSLIQSVTGPADAVTNTYEPDRDVLTSKTNQAGTQTVSQFSYAVNPLGQRTQVAHSGTAVAQSQQIDWNYNLTGELIGANHSAALGDSLQAPLRHPFGNERHDLFE